MLYRTRINNPKIFIKSQKTQIATAILRKMTDLEISCFLISSSNTNHSYQNCKIVAQKRHIDQWNRTAQK